VSTVVTSTVVTSTVVTSTVVTSTVVTSTVVTSTVEAGTVVVVPGDQDILDQPDGRGERPPGGRAAAYLPVGGQLEDGYEV
jgi:hypothetical protein